jgi:hypothetical protein
MATPKTLSIVALAIASPLLFAAAPDPSGLPQPGLEYAFSELVTLAPDITPGQTARGQRNIVPITGGTFEGPEIKGKILPGGWDWQLRRPDGCTEIEANYMLRTDDGVVINVINKGTLCAPRPGEAFRGRTLPVFEAPTGRYDWLSKSTFIGTLDPTKMPDGSAAVRIHFYRVV